MLVQRAITKLLLLENLDSEQNDRFRSVVMLEMVTAGIRLTVTPDRIPQCIFARSSVGKVGVWSFYRRSEDWLIETEAGKGVTFAAFIQFTNRWLVYVRSSGNERAISRTKSGRNLTVDSILICSQACLSSFVDMIKPQTH